MNYIASQKKGSVRLVGMSTACANATDLGNWLGVKEGLLSIDAIDESTDIPRYQNALAEETRHSVCCFKKANKTDGEGSDQLLRHGG